VGCLRLPELVLLRANASSHGGHCRLLLEVCFRTLLRLLLQ
jgi:hypothetical protein